MELSFQMTCSILGAAAQFLFILFIATSSVAQVNVLTYHNDNTRTGLNLNETVLTPANVASTNFGKLFSYPVDGWVFAQPLYVSAVNIPGQGIHNVLYIATEHNSVYAFDADTPSGATAGLLWKTNLGVAGLASSGDFGTRYGSFNMLGPEAGITGTPVIDLSSGTIFVDAFTHEGSSYFHRLHALNITNGAEMANSPTLVSVSVPGTGAGSVGGQLSFSAKQEIQRAALTLAGGIVYVAYAGYADTDPYHGWVIGFDATSHQLLTNYVFVTSPNSDTTNYGPNAGEGGIWMAGGGLAVDAATNLYFGVGNGTFTANNSGGTEYGDSIIRLSTSNHLAVADFFTPYNQASMATGDSDMGAGGTILLPDQPGAFPHLMITAGKGGKIYLINRDLMTVGNEHYDATNTVDHVVQTLPGAIGASYCTPVCFNGWVYFAAYGDPLKAFSLSNGLLSSSSVSASSRVFGFPGATPCLSANGTNSAIIWALAKASPSVLVACNATNLANLLFDSSVAAGGRDQLPNGMTFGVPTIANGKVYVGSQGSVSVYGLFSGALVFSSSLYSVPENAGTATVTVNRSGGTQGAVQVSYATVAGGTAASGVDYTPASGTLNWANGDATPKSFSITILSDASTESDETVNLALSAPAGGASLGGQSTAVLKILDAPYDTWRLAHFGANASNAAIAGDLADPDHDGIVNLLEYALATDPNVAGPNLFPAGSIVGNGFEMHFPRNTTASDLTYTVQTSYNAHDWTPLMTYTAASGWVANTDGVTVWESSASGSSPDQFVNVTIDLGAPGAISQFVRLGIHR